MKTLDKLKKLLLTPISTSSLSLGRAGRFAVFQLKMWTYCARLLRKNRAGQQAAALSYHTVFGLVPLAIVTLLIFQSFPAYSQFGEKMKNFVYDQFNFTSFESYDPYDYYLYGETETESLTDHLDKLIAGFFEGTNTGAVKLFSIAIVIWAALALLSTIEKAFNRIWHIGKIRGFLQRTINYWALLTLGPLLIALGIYMTTRYSYLGQFLRTFTFITPAILSFLITTVALFLLYFILPNTKVKARPAILGAALAAIVWIIAKNLFGYCVTELKLYNSVYGVLSLIPITVLWIYITWLIVLFGLQLTFTTQHLQSLDAAEIAAARGAEDYFIADEFVIINIVREIADAFEKNNAPVEGQVISSRLNIPAEFCDKILNRLVSAGILIKSSEPKAGFVPAKDPANIKLSDIADAVASVIFSSPSLEQPAIISQLAAAQKNSLAQYNVKQIITET
jgi:membrane protein